MPTYNKPAPKAGGRIHNFLEGVKREIPVAIKAVCFDSGWVARNDESSSLQLPGIYIFQNENLEATMRNFPAMTLFWRDDTMRYGYPIAEFIRGDLRIRFWENDAITDGQGSTRFIYGGAEVVRNALTSPSYMSRLGILRVESSLFSREISEPSIQANGRELTIKLRLGPE